ncbi:MAG: hypothetical protein LBQ57_11375 [Spirochaetales bacterium]|nr:hypothetical protein [Spirochaetales bacterium]
MFWIIILVILIAIAVVVVKNRVKENKRKLEQQQEEERQKHRKDLETRAAAGDEAAKQELIELGTDVSYRFSYSNFDYDKDALQRVYDLTFAAMTAKGIPWEFEMDAMKSRTIGNVRSQSTIFNWEGKTPRGDTLSMQYYIGRTTVSHINYTLHLKLPPELVRDVGEIVEKGMEEFLSTVPQWRP